ncbi:MAG: hypothetical protein BWY66_00362 [bacterium ADurb.Bin374]|nr:MAG: hypothetical protein BWY66_00362 [bacterium ADurb.Bin374]
MIWAQFWTESTGYVEGSLPPRFEKSAVRPIEACGSDAIVRLDARKSKESNAGIARAECVKRGYLGFSLLCGESLCRATTSRPYEATRAMK